MAPKKKEIARNHPLYKEDGSIVQIHSRKKGWPFVERWTRSFVIVPSGVGIVDCLDDV